MVDYEAPSSKRALEEFKNERTRKHLLGYARWFTHSEVDAEYLLADAIDVVCDPDGGRPWDPQRGSFVTHLRIVIRDHARRERRSARARREVLEPGYAFDERMAAPNPGADEALADARELEEFRRLGALLREALVRKGWTRAVQVYDAMGQDIERAEDVARFLGCDVAEVYEAKRQIAREGERILAEERKAAADRMKERREQAKKKEPK